MSKEKPVRIQLILFLTLRYIIFADFVQFALKNIPEHTEIKSLVTKVQIFHPKMPYLTILIACHQILVNQQTPQEVGSIIVILCRD